MTETQAFDGATRWQILAARKDRAWCTIGVGIVRLGRRDRKDAIAKKGQHHIEVVHVQFPEQNDDHRQCCHIGAERWPGAHIDTVKGQ